MDEKGFVHRKYVYAEGPLKGKTQTEQFGPAAFGALFFFITGFHGFHVFVGMLMLFFITLRLQKGHFTAERHFGFEGAAWYWHFVDVVWLFLFAAIYVWGGWGAPVHA